MCHTESFEFYEARDVVGTLIVFEPSFGTLEISERKRNM